MIESKSSYLTTLSSWIEGRSNFSHMLASESPTRKISLYIHEQNSTITKLISI